MFVFASAFESFGVRVNQDQLEAEGATGIPDGPADDRGFHGNERLKDKYCFRYLFTYRKPNNKSVYFRYFWLHVISFKLPRK